MTRSLSLTLALALTAGVALAHEGVKDPDVMARMELMEDIKAATARIDKMRRGQAPFDAGKAAADRALLVEKAEAIPDAFARKAEDPKSEALPAIWTDWDDFTARAEEMAAAAASMRTGSRDALTGSFGDYAATCRACHEDYRMP